MKQAEIRKTGYGALLVDALGVVGMLHFLRQLDVGTGNYTDERIQDDIATLEDFREFLHHWPTQNLNAE